MGREPLSPLATWICVEIRSTRLTCLRGSSVFSLVATRQACLLSTLISGNRTTADTFRLSDMALTTCPTWLDYTSLLFGQPAFAFQEQGPDVSHSTDERVVLCCFLQITLAKGLTRRTKYRRAANASFTPGRHPETKARSTAAALQHTSSPRPRAIMMVCRRHDFSAKKSAQNTLCRTTASTWLQQ